ncbi:MAG: hypothetical protein U0R26_11980 [Solirubrobacterales bacterium]
MLGDRRLDGRDEHVAGDLPLDVVDRLEPSTPGGMSLSRRIIGGN